MTEFGRVLKQKLQRHSSLPVVRGALAGVALALAAWAGASWQASRVDPLEAVRQQAASTRLQAESVRLRAGLADLAGRLGTLQGRLLAMESERERMAQASGLIYAAPELAVDTPVSEHRTRGEGALRATVAGFAGTAESLGRRIDDLAGRLDRQEDATTLMDVALSRQAGLRSSLPTASPLSQPYQSSSFGWRQNPVSGRYAMHEGLDFPAPRGATIRAASGGAVVRAGPVRGYGRMVEIDHGNGLRSRYAHASRVLVKAGDFVRQGDPIAQVGSTGHSTGPHLHFEIRMADYPLDPELFVGRDARTRLAHEAAPGDPPPARLADRSPGASEDLHAGG
ncbi:YD repeat-containing protein OS=Castellaniella defragrans OX=75697 GN=HNR28_001759 PE=4 SV=1 [Castellaniella defragrans]